MPNPLDILKDPNYVKANTATKQAIFNARVATLPEYRSANPATQADIRRRFNIETAKERYIRQQLKIQADQKSALRNTGSKIASAVSGAERGIKSVADKLSYLNPLEYIPDPKGLGVYSNPFSGGGEAVKQKRLATYAAERQQANPNTFAGGKIAGEIAATLPLTMGGGKVVELGGRALTKVMPRTGAVVEKFGRAVTSGGTGVRAPTGAAETTGKIIAKTRRARNAYRAAGGSASSLIAAAATDQDLTDAALAGAVVPVLGHILKFGAGKTYDIIAGRAGPVEAARVLRELITDNASQIAKALRNAPKDIKANTAEFLASRGLLTRELAGATQIASGSKQQGQLVDLALERAKGQNRMRQVIAGGENPTKAVSNIAAAKKQMRQATEPLREGSLAGADIGRTQIIPLEREAARLRQLASEEAENARRLLTANDRSATLIRESGLRLPADIKRQREIVAGLERFGGEAADRSVAAGADARAAEAAAANLRAQGLAPLDISTLVSSLRQKASEAEFVSPDRFKILSEFANNLERRAAKMGNYIDATGLYLARREMSSFVSSILNTSDPKALRQGTAQLIGEAQPLIDDAIEAAGGRGWKAYLNSFAEGMKGIERQQFQRQLAELPDDQFAKVMAGKDPDYVEDFFGPGRTDINVEMQGPTLATANKLGRDIEATQAVKSTGLEGLSDAQKLNFEQGITANVGDMLKPKGLNAFAAGARLVGSIPKVGGGGMVAQQFGEDAARKASERTMTALVPALASPRQAGELLRVRPAEDYISKFLYGSQSAAPLTSAPRQFAPGTAAQAVANRNALTPAQQAVLNQNTMSQARQQAVAQTGVANMTPQTMGEEFGFPDFDPETGDPLINIDYSEGYPVPIYGKVSRNSMRR
jgi:hypothetical protein